MNSPQQKRSKRKNRSARSTRRQHGIVDQADIGSVAFNRHHIAPSDDDSSDDRRAQQGIKEVSLVIEVANSDDVRCVRAIVKAICILNPEDDAVSKDVAKAVMPQVRVLHAQLKRQPRQNVYFDARVFDIVKLEGARIGWEKPESELIRIFADGALRAIRGIYDFNRWIGTDADLRSRALEIGHDAYEAWMHGRCECAWHMTASHRNCLDSCCKPQHRASGWDPSKGQLRYFVYYHVFGVTSGKRFLTKLFASSMSRHLFTKTFGLIFANVVYPVCKTCKTRLMDELTPCSCHDQTGVEWRLDEEVPILPNGLFGQYQKESQEWVCCTGRRNHSKAYCNCVWQKDDVPVQCMCCGRPVSRGKLTAYRFMGDLSTIYKKSDGEEMELETVSASSEDDLQYVDDWFNFLPTVQIGLSAGQHASIKANFLGLTVHERQNILKHLEETSGCEDIFDLFLKWNNEQDQQQWLSFVQTIRQLQLQQGVAYLKNHFLNLSDGEQCSIVERLKETQGCVDLYALFSKWYCKQDGPNTTQTS